MSRLDLSSFCLLLAVSLGSVGEGSAGAAVMPLSPSQDTYISERFGGPNGAETDMVIGTQGFSASFTKNRGLLQFDLSSIPAGAVVNSVTLRLTVTQVPFTPANSNFHLHRLLRPWNGLESTWRLRLGPDQDWDIPGGQEGTDFSAVSSANVLVAGLGDYTFASAPELIADVNAWLANPSTNHGWLVKTEDESVGFTGRRLASGESGSGTPVLEIEFEAPPPPLRIHRAAIVDGTFCLSFNAEVRGYVVERREKADEGEWTPVSILPAGEVPMEITVCDPLTDGNRFYRIREM